MHTPKVLLGALAAVGFSSVAAQALPVTGQISLGGYAQAVGSMGMGAATGISFANASGSSVTGTSGTLASYGAGSGAFAALGACASTTTGCGTIVDISSFSSVTTIANFLTLNTGTGPAVSFDLTSITSVGHATDLNGGSVTFTASGIINYAGYNPTAGSFILTAQGNNIVSFSATTLAAATVTAVPEPMSIALLGSALTVIGLVRHKKA